MSLVQLEDNDMQVYGDDEEEDQPGQAPKDVWDAGIGYRLQVAFSSE